MRSLIAGLTILLVTSSLVLAEEPESARQLLERRGIPFTEDEFVDRAKQGDLPVIELMLDSGMTPDAKDKNGTPALIAGLFESKVETRIVWPGGITVFYGASPGEVELFQESLGITEVEVMQDPQILAMAITLLDRDANPNIGDKRGTTAIMYAAQEGNEEIARALLNKGADVNAKNVDGESALIFATENGHTAVAAMLIENGADVNAKSHDGSSALKTAMDNGLTEIVKLLLNSGIDLHTEYLTKSINGQNDSDSQPPGVEERIKALEAVVIILQSENVSRQNKIDLLQNQLEKLQIDVVELKKKAKPGLELLSGN
jgi:ankyrin repeat protein